MDRSPSIITTALLVVAVIFPVLAMISIGLRFWARRISKQPLGGDDYTIILSMVFCCGVSINAFIFAKLGGIDYSFLDPKTAASTYIECLWINGFPHIASLTTVKVSIVLFYKRIFTTPKFKFAAWTTIAVITAWGTAIFLVQLFQANPISSVWSPGGSNLLINASVFDIVFGALSVFLDLLILTLPLPVLYRLHMNKKKKVAIAGILWLGAFCCVASIVRLVLLIDEVFIVASSQSSAYSLYYSETNAYVFTIIEPNCSVIAACLPTYGPLFAGGRSPESLIRSVRSLFSLRSSSRRSSRTENINDDNPADSTVELHDARNAWNSSLGGQNDVRVDVGSKSSNEVDQHIDKHEIGVTTTYGSQFEAV